MLLKVFSNFLIFSECPDNFYRVFWFHNLLHPSITRLFFYESTLYLNFFWNQISIWVYDNKSSALWFYIRLNSTFDRIFFIWLFHTSVKWRIGTINHNIHRISVHFKYWAVRSNLDQWISPKRVHTKYPFAPSPCPIISRTDDTSLCSNQSSKTPQNHALQNNFRISEEIPPATRTSKISSLLLCSGICWNSALECFTNFRIIYSKARHSKIKFLSRTCISRQFTRHGGIFPNFESARWCNFRLQSRHWSQNNFWWIFEATS